MNPKKNRTSQFKTTNWSLVIKASDGDTKALQKLCSLYVKPIYIFIRGSLKIPPSEAEDLVQEVFLRILKKGSLKKWKEGVKSLRSRLMTEVRSTRRLQEQSKNTMKNGGHIVFDSDAAEKDLQSLEGNSISPEDLLHYQWAQTQMEKAAELVTKRYSPDIVKELIPCLIYQEDKVPAGIEDMLGQSRETFRQTLHRLRMRFRAELINLVEDTVGNEPALRKELVDLYGEDLVEKYFPNPDHSEQDE